jgi:hypothetical protein
VTTFGTHRTTSLSARFIVSICVVTLFTGCSGNKPYPNGFDKNLSVHTVTDSGTWLSSVRATVNIHSVSEDCTSHYEGTVTLDDRLSEIGLPPRQWSYLVFVFDTSSLLGNRSGTITYETMIKPIAGYRYEAAVSYKNDIYNVTIREFASDRSKSRELDRVAVRACRSASDRALPPNSWRPS